MPKKKSKPIPMKVFHLSMECYPVAKVGGLAPRCRAIASRGPGIANHRNLTPAAARNEIPSYRGVLFSVDTGDKKDNVSVVAKN